MIIYNAIRCPDGTVIQSKYTHDYVCHTQEDGRTYCVDGGREYQRVVAPDRDYLDMTVTTDDDHSIIREYFEWTSNFDKEGKFLKEFVTRKLCNLENSHVLKLVEFTKSPYPKWVNKVFRDEVKFRGLTLEGLQ